MVEPHLCNNKMFKKNSRRLSILDAAALQKPLVLSAIFCPSLTVWFVLTYRYTFVINVALWKSLGRIGKKRGQQQTRETPDCQVGPDDEWTSRRTIIYNRRPVDIFSQRDVYCYGCCCCCSFPSIFLHAPSQILFGGRHSLITQSQHKRIDGPGNFPLSLFL